MKNYKKRGAIIGGIVGIFSVILNIISINITSQNILALLIKLFGMWGGMFIELVNMILISISSHSFSKSFLCNPKDLLNVNNCFLPGIISFITFIIFLSLFGALVGSMIKRKGNEE
jgi:hypothetical protein